MGDHTIKFKYVKCSVTFSKLLPLFQVSKSIVDKAIEVGINFFDTAEVNIIYLISFFEIVVVPDHFIKYRAGNTEF